MGDLRLDRARAADLLLYAPVGAAPEDARTTSRATGDGAAATATGSSLGDTSASSRAATRCAADAHGRRTVVSPGSVCREAAKSPTPTTDTRAGTATPA